MEKLDIPLAPASLGLILGPMIEANMRISMVLSRGDLTIFFTRPVSLAILAVAAVIIATPLINSYRKRSVGG
jgi:putative tricarboxylic transport membrane protein